MTLPRDLETICLKCLRKDRARRYASTQELAEDLRRWLEGEAILARRLGVKERLGRWTRRHPAAAALVGVSVLALLGLAGTAGVYGLYQSQQASIYRDRLDRSHKMREDVTANLPQPAARGRPTPLAGVLTELTARSVLDAQPDLQAVDLREEVRNRLAGVARHLERQQLQQQAQERRQRFQAARDDALFHETLFTGLDLADSKVRTRASARQALPLYGLAGEAAAPSDATDLLTQARVCLSEPQYADVAAGCYELLLVWAEVEATSPPGEPADRARRALRLLDRARPGGAHTLEARIYQGIRKTCYQVQAGLEPVPRAVRRKPRWTGS